MSFNQQQQPYYADTATPRPPSRAAPSSSSARTSTSPARSPCSSPSSSCSSGPRRP
ncbi:hypothetical protein [Nannocystis pusilla]|uniref:hypothetical protein n=1 Tax=Nannocystis pusilla TaxID=889268 RepID=UPI003B7F176B